MDLQTEKQYIANRQQLMRLRTFRFEGGRAQGVLATEVQSGELFATVVADRCMDLYEVIYKGCNIGFYNRMGVCSPYFYDAKGENFQYTFTAGFLSTCGLTNFGASCNDPDALGQHGRIGATPAEQYSAQYQEENGLEVLLRGEMVQARLFGENLRLKREYRFTRQASFTLLDTVTNEGSRPGPYQHLYHINFGHPFLDESCELLLPTSEVIPRDQASAAKADSWNKIEPPTPNQDEVCYYHRLKQKDGRSMAGVYNHNRGIGVVYSFDMLLDHFIQWKYTCAGEYVLGLEPCNSIVTGRDDARAKGVLKELLPGQTVNYRMEFQFFGPDDLQDVRNALTELE